jgi:hypothetical protein
MERSLPTFVHGSTGVRASVIGGHLIKTSDCIPFDLRFGYATKGMVKPFLIKVPCVPHFCGQPFTTLVLGGMADREST